MKRVKSKQQCEEDSEGGHTDPFGPTTAMRELQSTPKFSSWKSNLSAENPKSMSNTEIAGDCI